MGKIRASLLVIISRFCRKYRQQIVAASKLKLAVAYVSTVKALRLGVIGWIAGNGAVFLLGVGFVFFHVGLFILLPWTFRAKAWSLLFCGVTYMALAIAALLAAVSERMWVRKARIREVLDAVIDQDTEGSESR